MSSWHGPGICELAEQRETNFPTKDFCSQNLQGQVYDENNQSLTPFDEMRRRWIEFLQVNVPVFDLEDIVNLSSFQR